MKAKIQVGDKVKVVDASTNRSLGDIGIVKRRRSGRARHTDDWQVNFDEGEGDYIFPADHLEVVFPGSPIYEINDEASVDLREVLFANHTQVLTVLLKGGHEVKARCTPDDYTKFIEALRLFNAGRLG